MEWGSHRAEFGLSSRISSELVSNDTFVTDFVDPVLGRIRSAFHPQQVAYELLDVDFSTSTGVLMLGDVAVRESIPAMQRHLGRLLKSEQRISLLQEHSGTPRTAILPQKNYYHFIVEDLTRIAYLKEVAGVSEVLLDPNQLTRFSLEGLEMLGVGVVPVKGRIHLKSIWFTPLLGQPGIPSPLVNRLLRAAMPSDLAIASRMIYVSRRKSSRPWFRERELERDLRKLGFEIVMAEKLSFLDQVKLFAEARVVVGPHGAGLTNSVFMPDGATIIELLNPSWANPVYQVIAGTRLKYHAHLSDGSKTGNQEFLAKVENILATT